MKRNPQINIRIPQELKDKLHESAALNGRSVNSDINYRLESSFIGNPSSNELLSPEEAKAIAKMARENLYSVLLNNCIEAINTAAKNGAETAYVDVYKVVGEDYMDDDSAIVRDVVDPVRRTLEDIGYNIEIDGHDFCISFNCGDN